MDWNRLYNTDCIEGMSRIPDGSIDLAFADPPFNIGYKYDVYEDRMAADEYLAWTKKWGAALVKTLKPTGTAWLAIGDDFAAELKLLFQRELGLFCRSWVIWYYTFGVNCKQKFSRSHTHLFHFVKDPKNFTFNTGEIRVPSARQLVYADSRADSKGRLPDDTWILRPQDAPESFTRGEDVWYFPRVCGTFKERAGWHGCQMPEQLLGRIIKSCSNTGEIVLDPFGGSGTTLAVAKKLGRQFVGFELSKNYAKQIQSRLDAVMPQDALSGAEEPQVSAPSTAAGKRRKGITPKSAQIVHVPKRSNPFEVNLGIKEAFFTARDGFPVDRVIADPDLNNRFIDVCRRFGLPGEPRQWNRRLMNLRKAGEFTGLPRGRVTTFPLEEAEFEQYKFACEMAIQKYSVEGSPLDEVLCDPELAKSFDETVLSMISKPISALKIRWYSLRLRKRASKYKARAKMLDQYLDLPRTYDNPLTMSLSRVPATPGLYWLRAGDRQLYIGDAWNLRERLELQFSAPKFNFDGVPRDSLEIGYRAVEKENANIVAPNQSIWIGKGKKPEWNWNLLSLAQAS